MIDMCVAIAAADDAEFGRLASAIGKPRAGARSDASPPPPRASPTRTNSKPHIDGVDLERSAAEARDDPPGGGCGGRGMRAQQVRLGEDPHLKERDYWVYLDHPEVGMQQHCGMPWRMSRTEARSARRRRSSDSIPTRC